MNVHGYGLQRIVQWAIMAILVLEPSRGVLAQEASEAEVNRSRFTTGKVEYATGGISFRVESMVAPAQQSGNELRFNLAADALFDFDKADLRPGAEGVLRELIIKVKGRSKQPNLRAEGHTDAKGDDTYNLKLSGRRAESVRTWLVRNGGISANNIKTAGFGKKRSVGPTTNPDGSDNPEDRQRNRRVEIIVTYRDKLLILAGYAFSQVLRL